MSRCSGCGFATEAAQDRASGRVLCDDCLQESLEEIRLRILQAIAELAARRAAKEGHAEGSPATSVVVETKWARFSRMVRRWARWYLGDYR